MASKQISILVDDAVLSEVDVCAANWGRSRNWTIGMILAYWAGLDAAGKEGLFESSQKKIAKVSGGAVAQDGGNPGLSRGGKAQSKRDLIGEVFDGVKVKFGLLAQGHFATVARMRDAGSSWEEIGEKIGWAGSAVEQFFRMEIDGAPQWSEERLRELAKAEEEALSGSGGLLACSPELYAEMMKDQNKSEVLDGEVPDVARREDVGEGGRGSGRSDESTEKGDDVAETSAVGNRKQGVKNGTGRERKNNSKARYGVDGRTDTVAPTGRQQTRESVPDAAGNTEPDRRPENGAEKQHSSVNMDLLRDICKGNIPATLGDGTICDENPVLRYEVDLCGKNFFNEVDGENYVCGKEKHGPKVKCGDWIKI